MLLLDGASSSLHNWDLLFASRVYIGLLNTFIADPHTPLYLINSITHIRVTKKNKIKCNPRNHARRHRLQILHQTQEKWAPESPALGS